MGEPSRAAAIERELTRFYDQEAADRAGRDLGARRVDARDRFLGRLAAPRPRLLEIGPGPGRDAEAFVAAGAPVVGVDLSVEHAVRAREVGVGAVVATVHRLPLPDGGFGALWTMSTLMHVPDTAIEAALGEVRRVVAPGASAAFGTWGGPDVEHRGERDVIQPARFFCRRSDERWRDLLGTVGAIDEYDTWHHQSDGWWYQWAVVRVR